MGQLGLGKTIASAALLLVLGLPDECWARGHGGDDEADESMVEDDELGDDHEGSGDAAAMAPDPANAESKPAAPDDAHAWSFGPYLRYVVVPSFMVELFVDLAPNITNPAF